MQPFYPLYLLRNFNNIDNRTYVVSKKTFMIILTEYKMTIYVHVFTNEACKHDVNIRTIWVLTLTIDWSVMRKICTIRGLCPRRDMVSVYSFTKSGFVQVFVWVSSPLASHKWIECTQKLLQIFFCFCIKEE